MIRKIPSKTAPLSPDRLKDDVSEIVSSLLDLFFLDIRGNFQAIGPEGERYWEFLKTFSRQGKMSRPLLYFSTLLAFRGRLPKRESPEAKLGLMVEMTHFTSLLIDDFIDQDAVRRNEWTFHEFLKADGKTLLHQSGAVSGTSFILLGALRNILINLDIPIRKKHALLELHNTHEQLVAEGFLKELEMAHLLGSRRYDSEQLSLENFRAMTELKTGILIREPLLIACIMAGYPEKTAEYSRLKRFGTQLGIAYQIRDDIIDLFDENQKQRPMGSDIRENKPSILTILALLHGNVEQRALFIKLLEQCRRNPKTLLYLKNLFRTGGILDLAEREYALNIEKAAAELEALKNETRCSFFARTGHVLPARIIEEMKGFSAPQAIDTSR